MFASGWIMLIMFILSMAIVNAESEPRPRCFKDADSCALSCHPCEKSTNETREDKLYCCSRGAPSNCERKSVCEIGCIGSCGYSMKSGFVCATCSFTSTHLALTLGLGIPALLIISIIGIVIVACCWFCACCPAYSYFWSGAPTPIAPVTPMVPGPMMPPPPMMIPSPGPMMMPPAPVAPLYA